MRMSAGETVRTRPDVRPRALPDGHVSIRKRRGADLGQGHHIASHKGVGAANVWRSPRDRNVPANNRIAGQWRDAPLPANLPPSTAACPVQ